MKTVGTKILITILFLAFYAIGVFQVYYNWSIIVSIGIGMAAGLIGDVIGSKLNDDF